MRNKPRLAAGGALAMGLCAQVNAPGELLCKAAREGDAAQVRALLEQGANPNVRDEMGLTPLAWAASLASRATLDATAKIDRNFAAAAELLLDRGAEVNARDEGGRA